jgi:hypothetical protein
VHVHADALAAVPGEGEACIGAEVAAGGGKAGQVGLGGDEGVVLVGHAETKQLMSEVEGVGGLLIEREVVEAG